MNDVASILVVDDEESIRWTLERFLNEVGFEVRVASHAGEAKVIISEREFQAAVIDRILPEGQDGLELIRYLNQKQPDCQNILISASPSFESAAETLRYDTFAYLVKPLQKEQICRTVKEAVEHGAIQKERKHHEAFFHSLFDSSPNPIVICDLLEHVTFINPAFSKVFGFDPKEILGRSIDFIPQWDLDKSKEEVASLIRGCPVKERETQRLCKNGHAIDVTIGPSLCLDNKGDPKDILFIFRDTREAKAMEKHVLQNQRMEAIGALAGGIAHDFSNILQVIAGTTELLLIGKGVDHPEHRRLRRIDEASASGIRLVKQLLQLGNSEESLAERVDVNETVKRLVELLRNAISGETRIELHLEPGLPSVAGNSGEIEQSLINICMNARDAILGKKDHGPQQEGDRIIIETSACSSGEVLPWNPEMAHGGRRFLRIAISDTGCGMDDEIRARIFDPFFTTKEKGKGTGLGLSMVYRIVKRHEGEIVVQSVPGKGSSFKIYLPAADNPCDKDAQQNNSNSSS